MVDNKIYINMLNYSFNELSCQHLIEKKTFEAFL